MKLQLAICASALALANFALGVSVSPVGTYFTLIDGSGSGAGGLSGITYDPANDLFYTVNDSDSKIYPIDLNINLTTGVIISGTVGTPLQLKNGSGVAFGAGTRDQEGIAFDAATSSVWVSHEGLPVDGLTPTLTRHSLSNGNQNAAAVLPPMIASQAVNGVRSNKGLEALSRQFNGQSMWTSNESALNLDGPNVSANTTTKVRLTKYDAGATLVGQWVYQVDSAAVISTLADLLVLPDGKLIALERALDITGYRIRLYEVDFTGATEVSGVNVLDGSETLVNKNFLGQYNFLGASDNFEGLTIGPALTDGSGDYSLILTADNDNGTAGQLPFYALRISGIPEPGFLGLLGLTPLMQLRLRGQIR